MYNWYTSQLVSVSLVSKPDRFRLTECWPVDDCLTRYMDLHYLTVLWYLVWWTKMSSWTASWIRDCLNLNCSKPNSERESEEDGREQRGNSNLAPKCEILSDFAKIYCEFVQNLSQTSSTPTNQKTSGKWLQGFLDIYQLCGRLDVKEIFLQVSQRNPMHCSWYVTVVSVPNPDLDDVDSTEIPHTTIPRYSQRVRKL